MKKIATIIALSAIAATGCRKNPPYPPQPQPGPCCGGGTANGVVLVEVKDSTTMAQVMAKVIDSSGFTIQSMGGFNFYSQWPIDSFNAMRNNFAVRGYIDQSTQVTATGNSATPLYVRPSFYIVSVPQEKDWLALATQMKLQDPYDSPKSVYITVTPGTEETWAATMRNWSFVKSASVVYTMY